MPGEFSVYQLFPDGTNERIAQGVDERAAVEIARSYTMPNRPGVVLGVIDRVIIEDGDGYCCFEWKNGEGVTFPVECRGMQ